MANKNLDAFCTCLEAWEKINEAIKLEILSLLD